MILVSYYTRGTPYERDAALLRASCERQGVDHEIVGIKDEGGWHANTAMKPLVLMELREQLEGPLLYVDADAFVHRDPSKYVDGLRGDCGAHFFAGPPKGHVESDVCPCLRGEPCDREHRLLAGTLYLGDTDGCRDLLDEWAAFNVQRQEGGHIDGGGQKNLWAVWTSMRDELATVELPGRLCYVWDKPWAYPVGEPAWIEHTIASRENRPIGTRPGFWRRTSPPRRVRVQQLWGLVS